MNKIEEIERILGNTWAIDKESIAEAAKQIDDLYIKEQKEICKSCKDYFEFNRLQGLLKPPEEVLLSDEEIKRAAYKYNELYKGGRLEYTRKPNADRCIADEALVKAKLYYEAEKEKEIEGIFERLDETISEEPYDETLDSFYVLSIPVSWYKTFKATHLKKGG